ncbi:MAG: NAD-dependent epimerase/dehydratase family protein, partial [Clostridiales bacterium]
NLIAELENIQTKKATNYGISASMELYKFDVDTDENLLDSYTSDCDFVFHLAGVNRPETTDEFMAGNFGFTTKLLASLKRHKNHAPIVISSSTQAGLNNDYGQSKKAGEDAIFEYGKESDVKVMVYRLPNVFGKWCKPNYNSAVATFCHNIANNLPIKVNDPNVNMQLVYIDDVIREFIAALSGSEHCENNFCFVPTVHKVRLGEIADLLNSFKESRENLSVPQMDNGFTKALYSTYLSYLPKDKFSYPLKMNVDNRGSFTEIIRTEDRGQFSVNISKPHITKGNHWHHTKTEKFVVVSGKGLIQFRKIGTAEVIEYHVSGDKIEVVDIPTGYTHNIINQGETDMVTFMWCNECFNSHQPDTYFEEV